MRHYFIIYSDYDRTTKYVAIKMAQMVRIRSKWTFQAGIHLHNNLRNSCLKKGLQSSTMFMVFHIE